MKESLPFSLNSVLRDDDLRDEHVLTQFSEQLDATELAPYKGMVYTVLSELFTNMLEHGILGLASEMKSGLNGFDEYYAEKTARLGTLKDARLEIKLDFGPATGSDENTLHITMTHNGQPWLHHTRKPKQPAFDDLHGRGMLLIESLCEGVQLSEDGRSVHVWIKPSKLLG